MAVYIKLDQRQVHLNIKSRCIDNYFNQSKNAIKGSRLPCETVLIVAVVLTVWVSNESLMKVLFFGIIDFPQNCFHGSE